MRKILSLFLMLFIITTSVLTGCNLFVLDSAAYYAQTVAVSGNIKITMDEVISGYNNYGYEYVEQNGYTTEAAVEKIIDDLINKKYLLEYYDENASKFGIELEDADKWKALKATYDYINSSIESYENKIKTEWNIENSTGTPSEPEKDDVYINSPFVSDFILDASGNIVLRPIFSEIEEDKSSETDEKGEVILTEAPTFNYSSPGAQAKAQEENNENAKVFNEARKRYYAALKTYFENRGYKNKTNDELFTLEKNRIYKSQIESAKLNKLEKNFTEVVLRTADKQTELKQNIYNKYKELYNTAVQSYAGKNLSKYYSKMNEGGEIMYYHPTSNEYFTVMHILIPFSDETTEEIKQKKADVENGTITYESLLGYLETKQSNLRAYARDEKTGLMTDNFVLPPDVLKEIQTAVGGGAFESKVAGFREMLYKYNTDPGIMHANAKVDYLIPVNNTETTPDKMVEAFANEARKIRLDSNKTPGAMSGLVLSEYGYHIIMYTGETSNIPLVDDSTVPSLDNNNNLELSDGVKSVLHELFTKRVKADDPKTYFDVIYELVQVDSSTSYNTYLQNIVSMKRNYVDVKLYKNRYKKLV